MAGTGLAKASTVIEDAGEMRWRGEPAPRTHAYQPPAGEPRSGIRYSVAEDAPRQWSRPLDADISELRAIMVRAHADAPVEATLAFETADGRFSRSFDLVPGEQVTVLSTISFTQSEDVGGWDDVETLSLSLTSSNTDANVTLLGIDGTERVRPVADGEIFMYHPTSSVTDTARAFPIYAILDSTQRGGSHSILANHLDEMTGVRLPVNPDGLTAAPDLTNVILLGKEAATTVGTATAEELEPWGYSGFIIKADGPTVTIASKNYRGVRYGAYRFLEKQGCRFYGHSFANVIPTLDNPLLQTFELSDKPAIYAGGTGTHATRGGGFDVISNPQDIAPDGLLDRFWLDHTAAYLVPKNIYHDDHPEYYSELSPGKHLPKSTPDVRLMICLSNPDVLEISAERALAWIEALPHDQVYCITQADGADWCNCEACAALGNRADQTLHWVNHVARRVAEQYPDKILMTFAYNGAEAPPTRYKPEKNVEVSYAAWPNATSAPNSLGTYDHPANETAHEQLKGWMAIAPGQIGIYDYNSASRMTLYSMADRLKWMDKHDMGTVWYSGTNQMWPDLFRFVHGRLRWDPYEDVGRLKNEFIRAFYGDDAAPVVLQLFDEMYDRLMLGDYEGVTPPPSYYEYEFVDRIYDLFDTALELTAKGPQQPHNNLRRTRDLFIQNSLALRPGFEGELTDEQYRTFGRNLREHVEKLWWPEYRAASARHEAGQSDTAPNIDNVANMVLNLCYVDIGGARDDGEMPERLVELLESPKDTVSRYRNNDFVERTDRGWHIPGRQFRGARNFAAYSWMCPRRENTVAVYGALTDASRCRARFVLDEQPPSEPLVLTIEGQDSEKAWAPAARIQIWVNDRKVFDGDNEFPKQDWSEKRYRVPNGALVQGENTIEVRNLATSDDLTAHWVMFSSVRIATVEE
ncbi:MAG: DUF4838 domain-containing protein [Phycisphaeraceae bacterium]